MAVPKLPAEALLGVHPRHHVVKLRRGQDLAVGGRKGLAGQSPEQRDVGLRGPEQGNAPRFPPRFARQAQDFSGMLRSVGTDGQRRFAPHIAETALLHHPPRRSVPDKATAPQRRKPQLPERSPREPAQCFGNQSPAPPVGTDPVARLGLRGSDREVSRRPEQQPHASDGTIRPAQHDGVGLRSRKDRTDHLAALRYAPVRRPTRSGTHPRIPRQFEKRLRIPFTPRAQNKSFGRKSGFHDSDSLQNSEKSKKASSPRNRPVALCLQQTMRT